MFTTISLSAYAKEFSQAEAGRQLGITRANINAAIKTSRNITLTVDENGRIHGAYEVKPFGKRS